MESDSWSDLQAHLRSQHGGNVREVKVRRTVIEELVEEERFGSLRLRWRGQQRRPIKDGLSIFFGAMAAETSSRHWSISALLWKNRLGTIMPTQG